MCSTICSTQSQPISCGVPSSPLNTQGVDSAVSAVSGIPVIYYLDVTAAALPFR
jgi:hypothetical protein